MPVSTFSEDATRGHDHPVSTAARRERIDAHNNAKADIERRMASVCLELRQIARTDQHAVDVLHALSGGLASPVIKSSDIDELIDSLDMLADEVEYK